MKATFFAAVALVALSAVSCKSQEEAPAPPAEQKQAVAPAATPPPAGPTTPPKIAALQKALADKGTPATNAIELKSKKESTGCSDAQLRWRLELGSPGQFVNTSYFATPELATACFEDYKAAVMKGGQAAWDRLGPNISTSGNWLFLFSEGMDATRRGAVLTELKKVE